tara:strand:- start:1214 stop:1762 length:549 start_codon:yes stop_codon:yes gene_type:complete
MKPIDAAWYSLKKQLPDHMVNLPPSQSAEGHYGFGGAQSPRPPGSPGDDPRLATLDPNDLDAQDPRMRVGLRQIARAQENQPKEIQVKQPDISTPENPFPESYDDMLTRQYQEKEALHQKHSDETNIDDLWFNRIISRDPRYAKQYEEREALMMNHRMERQMSNARRRDALLSRESYKFGTR